MELIGLFGIVCSLVLSFIIANAGAKRQIGFGWSLFLGVWLTPIVSLIAVLLSDKLEPDEYGRVEIEHLIYWRLGVFLRLRFTQP